MRTKSRPATSGSKPRIRLRNSTISPRSTACPTDNLSDFVEDILNRMIFDGEQLVDLLAPLDLGWRDRTQRELALMEDLVPLLKKRAAGRTISGLSAYEQ